MSFDLIADPANPGHFFACCGLLELAHRLWSLPVTAHFKDGRFWLSGGGTLGELVRALKAADVSVDATGNTNDEPETEDAEEDAGKAAPLQIGLPFKLRLDWWTEPTAKGLKVWAGTMDGPAIFRAMVQAMPADATGELLRHMDVILQVDDATKKIEPFYFDARRGTHADTRDIGFSPNDQKLQTRANPAIEALTLIGLQRFRPMPEPPSARVFTYNAWHTPLPILAATVQTSNLLGGVPAHTFRFESVFRTSQRKHKAFTMATIIGEIP